MNSNNNEKLENVLGEALKFYEEGKSIPEILDLFPEYKKDLEEIFEVIELVRQGKDAIEPSKEVLSEMLNRIPSNGVTYLKIRRYPYGGGIKGRTSFIRNIINQIHKSMNLNWKIAFPIVGIVAIIAVLLIYSQSFKEPTQYTGEKTLKQELAEKTQASKPKEVTIPKATGNIDDAINAIIAFSTNEEYVLDEEDIDASLIEADNQAISDFGQSYGEDEF